jgi:uncharacterized cupredoxin-like copper-binding protein
MTKIALLTALALGLAATAHAASGLPGHTHGKHDGAGHGATATDGGPGKAAEATRTVRIEARDTVFNVKSIQVKAGETVRFIVSNKGQTPHEFAIASSREHEEHRAMMREMPDMVHDDPNVVTLQPGETKELVWKFGRDADLEFSCNLPGHAEQGMKGAFRVLR